MFNRCQYLCIYTFFNLVFSYPQHIFSTPNNRLMSYPVQENTIDILSHEDYHNSVWTFMNKHSVSESHTCSTTSFPVSSLSFHLKPDAVNKETHIELIVGNISDVDHLHIHGKLSHFHEESMINNQNYTSYKIRSIQIRKSPPVWRLFNKMSNLWKIMKLWNSIQKNGIHVYIRPHCTNSIGFFFPWKDPLRKQAEKVHPMPWIIKRQHTEQS